MSSKIVTISLPEDVLTTAKEFAKKEHRQFSGLIAISLERFIQEETRRGVPSGND